MMPRANDLRPLLPVYLVIFIAFVGYAMMVLFFVSLLMHDYGLLPTTSSTARAS